MRSFCKRGVTLLLALTLCLLTGWNNRAFAAGHDNVVIWFPTTSNDEILQTAGYVTETISITNPGEHFLFIRADQDRMYETTERVSKLLSKSANRVATKFNNQGFVDSLASSEHDYWLLMTNEAANSLEVDETLFAQLSQMLSSAGSTATFVLFGEGETSPVPGSLLQRLYDVFPSQVSYTVVAQDFTALAANGQRHSGDWFIAEMNGNPVDLDVVRDEADQSWSFDLPRDGWAFVLLRYTGNADELHVYGENGLEREGTVWRVNYNAQQPVNYIGLTMNDLPKGHYTVRAAGAKTEDVKAYYYPDIQSFSATLETTAWQYGDNPVTVRVSDDYGRPYDFSVILNYAKGEIANAERLAYNAEQNAWTADIPVSLGDAADIRLTPVITLLSKDGNVIVEWHGEERYETVRKTDISAMADAPQSITIYYSSLKGINGNFSDSWSHYFNFNPEEFPAFSIVPAVETSETTGEENNAVPGNSASVTSDGFTLVADAGQVAAQEYKYVLHCEDVSCDLTVNLVDTTSLTDAISIRLDENDAANGVAVTKPAKVIAEISPETVLSWQKASEQIPDWAPPETLSFSIEAPAGSIVDENGAAPVYDIPFASTANGGLTAELNVSVPDVLPKDSTLNLQCYAVSNGENMKADSVTVNVINDIPYMNREFSENTIELQLNGIPSHYESADLLTGLFGTNQPGILFDDAETTVRSLKVILDSNEGLTLPDNAETDGEGRCIIILTDMSDSVEIMMDDPVTREVTFVASDGNNESEEYVFTVKGYSVILRYLSFGVAGLLALAILFTLILIIRQLLKPKFDQTKLRCVSVSDGDQEIGRQMLSGSLPASMMQYGKKEASLSEILILNHQPPLTKEKTAVTDDIFVFPGKHEEVIVKFGKIALKSVGEHMAKETCEAGAVMRIRIDNTYVYLENVR